MTGCLAVGAAFVAPVKEPTAFAQEATADTVARDLQRKYDRVTDFSADFVHSYRGGVLKQQATERGTLLVKKPGKMRWEYTSSREEVVRIRRPQDLFVHSAGQAGDRRHHAA